MKISDMQNGDIGIYNNKRFTVTARYPEDRTSGWTIIRYDDATIEEFTWQSRDPDIIYLGKMRKIKNYLLFDRTDFIEELTALINKHNIDAQLTTPDFILADYLNNCLDTYQKLNDELKIYER